MHNTATCITLPSSTPQWFSRHHNPDLSNADDTVLTSCTGDVLSHLTTTHLSAGGDDGGLAGHPVTHDLDQRQKTFILNDLQHLLQVTVPHLQSGGKISHG